MARCHKRSSAPDWHGLVRVRRGQHAAICRDHRLHGLDAKPRAADDTHRHLVKVRDENLGNRDRSCSDLKVVQRLPSHHRIPVFDMELQTYLLVRLGIASHNLPPDNPAVRRLTVDRGTYYFFDAAEPAGLHRLFR